MPGDNDIQRAGAMAGIHLIAEWIATVLVGRTDDTGEQHNGIHADDCQGDGCTVLVCWMYRDHTDEIAPICSLYARPGQTYGGIHEKRDGGGSRPAVVSNSLTAYYRIHESLPGHGLTGAHSRPQQDRILQEPLCAMEVRPEERFTGKENDLPAPA